MAATGSLRPDRRVGVVRAIDEKVSAAPAAEVDMVLLPSPPSVALTEQFGLDVRGHANRAVS